jgi:hypothetical protein
MRMLVEELPEAHGMVACIVHTAKISLVSGQGPAALGWAVPCSSRQPLHIRPPAPTCSQRNAARAR